MDLLKKEVMTLPELTKLIEVLELTGKKYKIESFTKKIYYDGGCGLPDQVKRGWIVEEKE